MRERAGPAGRLERVLAGWTTGDAQVTLLVPSRRGQLAAVRALVDFLAAEYPALVAMSGCTSADEAGNAAAGALRPPSPTP